MKVFISGSISKKLLSRNAIAFLEQIVECNHTILIGDAFGVDKVVQQWLLQQDYRNVIVYFSGKIVRNNIGKWQTKQVSNSENLTGRSMYQLKDKAMADDCDWGIMFWNGRSKGTKDNIYCMENLGKPYSVLSEDDLLMV